MRQDQPDQQCLLLSGRSLGGGYALLGKANGEVGKMRALEGAAGRSIARPVVAQHRAVSILDLDRRP